MMELVYLEHSGFLLRGTACSVVIDFYHDAVMPDGQECTAREISTETGNIYVLASHAHADHFNPKVLEWYRMNPAVRYIFSADITLSDVSAPVHFLRKGEKWSDGYLTVSAFGSTDVGVSFLLEMEGKKLFHAGDLNNWHWRDESTPAEIRAASLAFARELESLLPFAGEIDVAMFPVDPRLGTDYDLGARQFVDAIRPRLFVPMHFWGNYREANAFGTYAESRGTHFVSLHHPGETVSF